MSEVKRKAMAKKRTYTSPLREQRAEETRRRILEGAIEVLSEGAAALTIPAVAKASGVAVPTVYRYFGSKEELEDGVARHVRSLVGLRADGPSPRNLDEVFERVHQVWTAGSELPPSYAALLLSSVGRELMGDTTGHLERRVAEVAEVVADALPDADEAAQRKVATVLAALCSSPAGAAYRRLGIGGAEAADLHEFVLRAMVEKVQRDGWS